MMLTPERFPCEQCFQVGPLRERCYIHHADGRRQTVCTHCYARYLVAHPEIAAALTRLGAALERLRAPEEQPAPSPDAPSAPQAAPGRTEASASSTALHRPWWMFWRA